MIIGAENEWGFHIFVFGIAQLLWAKLVKRLGYKNSILFLYQYILK